MLGISLRSSGGSGAASPSPSGGFKRLAAKPLKPLKLAASAIGSVPSRIGGGHRSNSGDTGFASSATATPDEELTVTLDAPASSYSAQLSSQPPPTGSTVNSAYLEKKKRSKIPGRRKHQKTRGGVGILDAAQVAQVAQGPRKPLEHEEPAAMLRVRVVSAEGLVVKDRNGSSDP